jgi:hypothetical protein
MEDTETELNACGAAVLTPTHTSQLFAYGRCTVYNPWAHRLNMELNLQSLFGLLCTAVLIG